MLFIVDYPRGAKTKITENNLEVSRVPGWRNQGGEIGGIKEPETGPYLCPVSDRIQRWKASLTA